MKLMEILLSNLVFNTRKWWLVKMEAVKLNILKIMILLSALTADTKESREKFRKLT